MIVWPTTTPVAPMISEWQVASTSIFRTLARTSSVSMPLTYALSMVTVKIIVDGLYSHTPLWGNPWPRVGIGLGIEHLARAVSADGRPDKRIAADDRDLRRVLGGGADNDLHRLVACEPALSRAVGQGCVGPPFHKRLRVDIPVRQHGDGAVNSS